jgi:MoaA/NifB/PqqE/SkfB family radical SAM enzyme
MATESRNASGGGLAYDAHELEAIDRRKRIASIFLLPHCDMSCTFCASEIDFSILGREDAVELLRVLRRMSFCSVVLGGGEPFLWPHGLRRLARRARDLGFVVQVCTNGASLPDGFERFESIDRYILPLESMDPVVHDRLRRHRGGHHAQVLERIETLAGSRRELTVSTVVTRENLDALPEIGAYLADLGRGGVRVHAWHLYRFLPVGRGGARNTSALAITTAEYLRACSLVQQRPNGFPILRRNDMLRSSTVEYFWAEAGRLRIGSRVFGSAAGAAPPGRSDDRTAFSR